MDELVKLVATKVGISPDQAEKAVTTVLGFLKERLPEPIAGQLDNLVAGGSTGAGGLDLGVVEGALGGLFDKK
jgi:hypothetical protein